MTATTERLAKLSQRAVYCRLAGLLAWAFFCGAALADSAENEPFGAARLQGLVTDVRLPELSGLAKSRRHPDLLWAINDSSYPNELFAITSDGEVRARFEVSGARNVDWEDLAIFELDQRWYLLIADFGDNGGVRDKVVLYVVPEPDLPEHDEGVASVAWQIVYRYPDSPQDAESVAVDTETGEVLVLNKRRVPATLYSLPLQPEAGEDEVLVAKPLGQTVQLPQPGPEDIDADPRYGHFRSQPTAMDLSPDRLELIVLTYRWAWLYRRDHVDQPWGEVLSRPPLRVDIPLLPQGEAIAYSGDGRELWLSSERLPAPLLRLQRHQKE